MLTNLNIVARDDPLDRLRAYIDTEGFSPGDRLPPERDLTVSLNLSRSTLRKALDALEREGAIWRHVGKGTFIAAKSGGDGGVSLAELSNQVTPVHLTRARMSLEPAMAREAAVNASAEAIARLKLARDRARNAATWDEYEAQDDVLHRAVAQAADNPLLLALFDQLNQVRRAVAWNSVVRTSERPPRDHSSFAEHDQLVAAIEARDAAAAHAAMRTHLGSVAARLFADY